MSEDEEQGDSFATVEVLPGEVILSLTFESDDEHDLVDRYHVVLEPDAADRLASELMTAARAARR